jgi:hypothetical protein
MSSTYIWWNYLLAGLDAVGLIALLAVGRKKASGWLWAMLTQAVWIVYSTVTFQWGFLAVAVIKLAVYTWNWASWLRDDKTPPADEKTPQELALDLVRTANPAWSAARQEFTAQGVARLVEKLGSAPPRERRT